MKYLMSDVSAEDIEGLMDSEELWDSEEIEGESNSSEYESEYVSDYSYDDSSDSQYGDS